MGYGNETESASDGDATFLFFDDFEDGTWTDKWLQSREDASYDYATITESNGKVTFTNCCQWNFYCSQGPGILISKSNFTISNEGFVLDVDYSIASDNAGYSSVRVYIVGDAMYGDPKGTCDRHYGIDANSYSTDKTRAFYPPEYHQTDDHLLTYTLGVPYRHIVNYSGSALLNITVYDKNGQVAGSHDYSLSYSDSATLRVMLYVQSAGSYYRDVKLRKYASPEPTTSIGEDELEGVPPVPELPTIILFSIGLLVLAGYVYAERRRRGEK